jgi:hypothetical protein
MVKFDWKRRFNNSCWGTQFVSWGLTRYPQRDELLPMVERCVALLTPLFGGGYDWGWSLEAIEHDLECARHGRQPDPKVWAGHCCSAVAARHHLGAAAALTARLLGGVREEDEHPYGWSSYSVVSYLEQVLGWMCWVEHWQDPERAKTNYRARMAQVFGDLVSLGEPLAEEER